MQQLSSAGAGFVRGLEGFVGHFYLDAATPPVGTIGEGFTMRSGAFRFWWMQHKGGVAFGPGATMTPRETGYGANWGKFKRHIWGVLVRYRHLSERRACSVVGADRKMIRYRSCSSAGDGAARPAARPGQRAAALRLPAAVHPAAGGRASRPASTASTGSIARKA